MIKEKSLVIYKNKAALVNAVNDKISISTSTGEQVRVREKDIELLHPGPLSTLKDLEAPLEHEDIQGAWELLEDNEVALSELTELVYGSWTARTAWAAYELLKDGTYFEGTITTVKARSSEEIDAEIKKRTARDLEAAQREAFLERLRTRKIKLPEDARQLQDVEALAYGKSEKSRTLKELGKNENPVEAHTLLLETGYWTKMINPYPLRFGLNLSSADTDVAAPPEDNSRTDLRSMEAYAIDNKWSSDPDDALSFDGEALYVHIADPAASIPMDSPADLEARGRGATYYLPEGSYRMIHEEALTHFALGLQDYSAALTFKISFNENGSIASTDIIKSIVKVTRLTYAEADAADDNPLIQALFSLAARNEERRIQAGAVQIDFPEVHISVENGKIDIDPIVRYRSADMVRECMLLAGEAAARWAMKNNVPFPFVAQELGDLPNDPLPGLAGSFQKRRCMRPRRLSAQPGAHGGLGLGLYTQVTSPLRRYTDLLAHQQIRRILEEKVPLDSDEILTRVAAGEAASLASVQAERASRQHWTAVYLSEHIGSRWEAVVLERKGNRATLTIPALALETQVQLSSSAVANDSVELCLSSVRIPELDIRFSEC